MRTAVITTLAGLFAVCNSPASESGDPAAAPRQSTALADPSDPYPEWDRPMPFVDQGWLCNMRDECVWSEEAVVEAKMLLFGDEERPKTAFCYSGVFNNDLHDFDVCTKTMELCEARRTSLSNGKGAPPCREMTPTDFWRENPLLVEARRKICKPQDCPSGYSWVSAAKLRGESLDFAAKTIEELDGGYFAIPSSDERPRGFVLHEDRDCIHGCEVRCPAYTFACEGTPCRRCFSGEDVTPAKCEAYLSECAEVMAAVPKDRELCTTDGTRRCPSDQECVKRYSEAVPEEVRLHGSCRPRSTP